MSVVLPGFIRDSGMFHDAGVKLPRFVGTKTPEDVAAGVLRAIERDRAEIDVAPLGLRAGAPSPAWRPSSRRGSSAASAARRSPRTWRGASRQAR